MNKLFLILIVFLVAIACKSPFDVGQDDKKGSKSARCGFLEWAMTSEGATTINPTNPAAIIAAARAEHSKLGCDKDGMEET